MAAEDADPLGDGLAWSWSVWFMPGIAIPGMDIPGMDIPGIDGIELSPADEALAAGMAAATTGASCACGLAGSPTERTGRVPSAHALKSPADTATLNKHTTIGSAQ
ncbi:MAG: hypothetical protein NVS3B20_21470 [Polyangiales bacterium]